ncbi:hypothetical protein E1A91_A13G072800v1 [Gossypium mustelinum]|uniref:Uncharacterized protein n=1 Tax=Gossypium mustelinum TaxID=34275 RepID=A0A5D2WFN1_GOSMU|nr:hypothetical protein E1A91_A13G072800v1 [Gossypium mustelinum]
METFCFLTLNLPPKGYGGAREWCLQRRGVAKGMGWPGSMGVTRVFPFLLFFYYWFGLELVVWADVIWVWVFWFWAGHNWACTNTIYKKYIYIHV